ncbi:MAG: insulinase family protein [Bacteroidales bacterium]|nr:insulinase family protein [Bacteroidales bacterium]
MSDDEKSIRDLNAEIARNILSDPILNVEKTVLSNGLTVLFNKDTSRDDAYMIIYVKAGAEKDPPGKRGMAHLYEHLAYREGTHNKFAQEMGKFAMSYNAGTNYNSMKFESHMLTEHLHKVMELESLRFSNIGEWLSQQDIDKEVDVIRNESLHKQSFLGYFTHYALKKILFRKEDRLSTDILGVYKEIVSVTPPDIVEFERHIMPRNTIIFVSGNYDSDFVFELVRRYFGNKENSIIVEPKQNIESLSGEQKHFYYIHDNFENMLRICYQEPGIFTRDWVSTIAALFYLCGDDGPLTKMFFKPDASNIRRFNTYPSIIKGYIYYWINLNEHADAYQRYLQVINNIDSGSITDLQLCKIQKYFLLECTLPTNYLFKMSLITQMFDVLGESLYKSVIDQVMHLTKEDIRYSLEKYLCQDCIKTLSTVRSSHVNLVLPGSIQIKKDKSWFTPISKSVIPGTLPGDNNTYSLVEKSLVLKNNYPSVWRFKLANGIRLFGSTIEDSKIIEGTVLIKLPRYSEKKGLSGTNYYCAKALTGTSELSPENYQEKVRMLNSEIVVRYYAYHTESIEIYFKSYRKYIKELFKLIEDSILTPLISEKHNEKEKGKSHRILAVLSFDDNSLEREIRSFSQLAYGKAHPFSRDWQGYLQDKINITVPVVKEHFCNYIKPDITDVCMAGDVTKEFCGEVLDSLEKTWQGTHKKFPARKKTKPAATGKIYIMDKPGDDNVRISFFKLAPPEKSKELYLLNLMGPLLGAYRSSLLYNHLREQDGLAYLVNSGVFIFGKESYFKANANTGIHKATKVFRIMHDTIFTLADTLDEDMLRYTIDYAIRDRNSYVNEVDAAHINLKSTAFYRINYNRRIWQNKILSTVTLSDFKEVAGRFFISSEFYFVVEGDKKRLMKPLSKLGYGDPVEIELDE